MNRRLSAFLIVAALAVATTLTAPSASASTWTVSPGGTITGQGATVVMTDTSTGAQMTCTSVAISGFAPSSSPDGTGLLNINTFRFTGCSTVAGITWQITQVGVVRFDGTSYNPATGLVTGVIVNVTLRFTGPLCSFTAAGSMSATYDNGPGTLRLGGTVTLVVSNVSGCFGLFRNGDRVTLFTSIFISPHQRITIP